MTQQTQQQQPPEPSAWSDALFADKDKLYRLIKGDAKVKGAFFWVSHTFSHQMLDNVTSDTMRLQLALNSKIAGEGFLGIAARPTYSRETLITPAISGLFNGDALAAMAAEGVTTAGEPLCEGAALWSRSSGWPWLHGCHLDFERSS